MLTTTGPGDSKEDVKWLDDKLNDFFTRVEKEEAVGLKVA